MNFFGGKNRRHLFEASGGFGSQALENFPVQCRRSIRACRLPFRVKGVGCVAETETGGVALAASGIETDETRGFAEEQNEDAGGEWIQGTEMADLAEAGEMANRVDDVVGGFALWFVDDQGAVKGSGLWLARHVTLFCDPISAIRVPMEVVVSQYY